MKLIGYCWIYFHYLDLQVPGVKVEKRIPRLSTLGTQQSIPRPFHFDQSSTDHSPICTDAPDGMKQKDTVHVLWTTQSQETEKMLLSEELIGRKA